MENPHKEYYTHLTFLKFMTLPENTERDNDSMLKTFSKNT